MGRTTLILGGIRKLIGAWENVEVNLLFKATTACGSFCRGLGVAFAKGLLWRYLPVFLCPFLGAVGELSLRAHFCFLEDNKCQKLV